MNEPIPVPDGPKTDSNLANEMLPVKGVNWITSALACMTFFMFMAEPVLACGDSGATHLFNDLHLSQVVYYGTVGLVAAAGLIVGTGAHKLVARKLSRSSQGSNASD